MELKEKEKKEKKRVVKTMLELLTENDEELKEFRDKKEARPNLLRAYYTELRFKGTSLPEPPQVAKWRMKQRVNILTIDKIINQKKTLPYALDEDGKCSTCVVFKHRSGSARCH